MAGITDMLTAGEAAEKLGYHLNHLYRLLAVGTVRGQKWGGRIWMIASSEVARVKALQDANGRLKREDTP
jgi:excisionase family DNA binding protein